MNKRGFYAAFALLLAACAGEELPRADAADRPEAVLAEIGTAPPRPGLGAAGNGTALLEGPWRESRPPQMDNLPWHEFYFTRAAYRSAWRRGSWAIDYPKADRQFLTVLRRLTNLDAHQGENAVLLTGDILRKYPFLYALEVGYINLSEAEVRGLRSYLESGGFLVIDDFWGSQEWARFEYQMKEVFPEYSIKEISLDHPIFHVFYDIEEILQVPAYGRYFSGRTSERDGYVPRVLGIEDDDGRLLVAINWNTDLGDAWEWAEQPDYPLKYSTFAYQMGVNMVVYAMSH